MKKSIYNFGICEGRGFSQQLQELYPGCPQICNSVRYSNEILTRLQTLTWPPRMLSQ